jgi:uncharacterized protein YndB with AHSA1/START domain
MKADLTVERLYRHPIDRVWAALTSTEALAVWLMPNDFQPVPGHEFTLRAEPAPGFDGVVHCRVLELAPPTRMVWSWRGGPIDTTVTFTLTPAGADTRFQMRQLGFTGLGGVFARLVLGGGKRRVYGRALPAYLDYLAGRGDLSQVRCGRRWWPRRSRERHPHQRQETPR